MFRLFKTIRRIPKRSLYSTQIRSLRYTNNKYHFSIFGESTKDLGLLESYTEGMMSLMKDDMQTAIIKFTETADIFENLGTDNLRICQSLYSIKQKQLLCFYYLKQFDYCLQVLKEIKELNQKLVSFVKQKLYIHKLITRVWKWRNRQC